MPEDGAAPAPKGGFRANFTKKVGPLPIWAWGIGGAAAVFLVFRWYKAKSAGSSTTSATPDTGAGLAAGTSSTPGSNGYQDNGQLTQLSTQLQGLSDLIQQQPKGPSAAASTTQGFSRLASVAAIQANAKNLYVQSSPGVFTRYTGSLTDLFKKGNTTLVYAPVNGQVSGAAAPSSAAAPSPVTSGPSAVPIQGVSLGGVPASSTKLATSVGGTPTQQSVG